jgi:hypothetical protein
MQDVRPKSSSDLDHMNGLMRLGRLFDEGMIEKTLAGIFDIREDNCILYFSVLSL